MIRAARRRLFLLIWLTGLAACTPKPVPELVPEPPPAPAAPAAEVPTFSQTGVASWYGAAHNGQKTASGERFNPKALTAAHPFLALGSVVRVTSVETGKSVKVRINDRGPKARGRIIDLSDQAARALDLRQGGLGTVRIEVFASDQAS